jgi:hypothetical protein
MREGSAAVPHWRVSFGMNPYRLPDVVRNAHPAALLLGYGLLHAVLAAAGYASSLPGHFVATFWPAGGLLLAACVICRRRQRWLLLVASLRPALFTETSSSMRINREEIFGPVASVMRVKDYDAALAAANDTPFGLSSGICTSSLKHATHFKRNAEAGMVMVNLPTAGVDYHVPFGGRKGSSFGPREQGRYAAEFFTTVKTAYTLP